jgi:hypothetical protein
MRNVSDWPHTIRQAIPAAEVLRNASPVNTYSDIIPSELEHTRSICLALAVKFGTKHELGLH